MCFHCLDADVENVSDLLVHLALGAQLDHPTLAIGEIAVTESSR